MTLVLFFCAIGKVQEIPETGERFYQVANRIHPNPGRHSYPTSARRPQRTTETELLPVRPQNRFQTWGHPDQGNLCVWVKPRVRSTQFLVWVLIFPRQAAGFLPTVLHKNNFLIHKAEGPMSTDLSLYFGGQYFCCLNRRERYNNATRKSPVGHQWRSQEFIKTQLDSHCLKPFLIILYSSMEDLVLLLIKLYGHLGGY